MEHPYGYIKDNKIYLKGFLDQEDRVIGEVKTDEASTIRYFERRFQTARDKVAGLQKDIETNQNKGSFLMKLRHLRDALMNYDALGDFVPLIEELNRMEASLEEIIQINRMKNLEVKKGLIQEAEALMHSTDWKHTTEAYKNLKLRWIKTGPVIKELEEEIEKSFAGAVDTFFENRKNYYDSLALQAEENIKVYEGLLLQARQAHELADVRLAFEISKKIQKQWKESGRVPSEKRQPLWDEFSKLNNRIFSKFKKAVQNTPALSPGDFIRKLEKMNEEAKILADAPVGKENLAAAKKLQTEWKKLPQRKPREAMQTIRSFIFALDVVFEKSFLHRLSRTKTQDFENDSPQDQKKVQIALLKDLISRDQRELTTIQENAEKFKTHKDDFDSVLHRKLSAYKRKLEVKNHILQELFNK
ncbi:MAG TPA: DUF349 domain-containing protein [Cyclobacteriaceae bacterium]|nr:DUF349 domain-containing protein [Cyclobacteriaceae bacterium]